MRAGPSGHTAAERTETRVLAQTPPSMGESRPDEDAYVEQVWAEMKAAGTPVSRRHIRQQLANAQADYDFGGIVLTYLSRRRSVPVDRWELRAS